MGHPLDYWYELEARAKQEGRDTLILRNAELKKDLAIQREINEHLLRACLALLEENKKGWK